MNAPAPPGNSLLRHGLRAFRFVQQTLARHSTAIIALAVRAGAVLAGFAVTFLIGHRLGAAASGQFALVNQTAMFLAVVGLMGLDIGVVRHFSRSVALKVPIARRAMAAVTGLALAFMIAIAAVLWLGGPFVWQPLFGDVVPRGMLLVLCTLLVARGGTQLLGGLLRSQHRFTIGQVIAALTIPAATALALVTGVAQSVEEALWAAAAGGLVSIAAGLWAMRRHTGSKPDAMAIDLKQMLASSLPLWGVGIANNIGDWYGLAVAAQLLGASDAGLYRVAIQIAGTLQIISIAIFSVYSAKISTAYHAEDLRQVAQLARTSVRLSTVTAVPAALVLLAGSGLLLAQIGAEFTTAEPLVWILVIGQLAFTLTGPCGLVLAMSGNERINLAITVCGTIILLVAAPIAANFGGLAGIAVCISAIMLLRNITAYVVVRRKLGIGIWTGTLRA